MSLIYGIKKFHRYLYGRPFTLITDHKPLFSPKKGTPSLAAARWSIILSAYQYNIKFRSTHEHLNADMLSCLPVDSAQEVPVQNESEIFNVSQLEILPLSLSQLTRADPILSRVFEYTKYAC